jgi:hypothetical protein
MPPTSSSSISIVLETDSAALGCLWEVFVFLGETRIVLIIYADVRLIKLAVNLHGIFLRRSVLVACADKAMRKLTFCIFLWCDNRNRSLNSLAVGFT